MQFLVIFTNKPEFATEGVPADFTDRMADDQQQLRRLYADGLLREVWTLDTEERGGAALFEVDSAEQLHEVVATVPFVKIGYNDYQAFPLAPYAGFGPRPSS